MQHYSVVGVYRCSTTVWWGSQVQKYSVVGFAAAAEQCGGFTDAGVQLWWVYRCSSTLWWEFIGAAVQCGGSQVQQYIVVGSQVQQYIVVGSQTCAAVHCGGFTGAAVQCGGGL